MKWIKSFLLHPWVNRFNLLYLFAGLTAVMTVPGDYNLGWFVLGGEAAYLTVRGILDRSRLPAFQLRRLPAKERQRYLRLWETARRVEEDLQANSHRIGAMSASATQVKSLLKSFLELLLAGRRIDSNVLGRRIDFNAEILKANAQKAAAQEAERTILDRNIEVLKKRQENYLELVEKRRLIDHRLGAIENAIELLAEVGAGLSDSSEAADQVQVILSNVEDAQSFVEELNQVIAPIQRQKLS